MKRLSMRLSTLSVALIAAATTSVALAQGYPNKPITFVVPFSAGGPTDRVARDLADAMRKQLNDVTIVIDNAAGAGSSIGTAKVARAPADGYTLLLTHIGMSTMPALYKKLSFNVQNDFDYLGLVNDVPMTLIARPTLPANNYSELSTWLKANQGKVNLGNAGLGSASQLCGLLYESATKAQMTTVPYKGTAPAIADLIGGQIDLLCDQTTNTSGQIEGKKVKAYAVTTAQRLKTPLLKDLPTLQESGLKGFEVTIWHGLYGPKGLPADVATKINTALKAALKDPDFIRKQEGLGAVVVTDKRQEREGHKQFVASEIAKWGPIIKAAGVSAD